jgi:phosphoglycolate phosphatase
MPVNVILGGAGKVWALDAAIVDLDGTMVDTIGDFAEAITRMLSDLQLPLLTAADIEHMVGKGTRAFAALGSGGGPDPVPAIRWMGWLRR